MVKKELFEAVKRFGVSRSRSDRAVDAAYRAQEEFRSALLEEGRRSVERVHSAKEKAIVLVGRAYNVFDRTINLSVAAKLAGIYGINVIPMDCIDVSGIPVDSVNPNMFWSYGKRIIQTALWVSREPDFDLIYITNFKCGPDSFIKQYIREALGKPFLALQFDGHSNDAGMMTRCEAYLDSKGFLSVWGANDEG
jgi:predicted nucleotide-binding protein (sugar kinase/HSP70/actin superfamily)